MALVRRSAASGSTVTAHDHEQSAHPAVTHTDLHSFAMLVVRQHLQHHGHSDAVASLVDAAKNDPAAAPSVSAWYNVSSALGLAEMLGKTAHHRSSVLEVLLSSALENAAVMMRARPRVSEKSSGSAVLAPLVPWINSRHVQIRKSSEIDFEL